jgi:3'-phosphoadenosine 5'-phosphosulfate sulfotransferase (PAPS reductase)/FAD synthetase
MMTYDELKYRQGWTLEQKIDHSVGVVSSFASKTGGGIFSSFSRGKDSTVMVDIIRRFVDRTVPVVFCNTGNEVSRSGEICPANGKCNRYPSRNAHPANH